MKTIRQYTIKHILTNEQAVTEYIHDMPMHLVPGRPDWYIESVQSASVVYVGEGRYPFRVWAVCNIRPMNDRACDDELTRLRKTITRLHARIDELEDQAEIAYERGMGEDL